MIARDTVKAWYFAPVSRSLRYGDDREIVVGETHSVSGPLRLCERGLHASERIIDALWYAPGPIAYRVELSGDMLFGDDKIVARYRRYIWGADATDVLVLFARRQALIHSDLLRPHCSEDQFDAVKQWLLYGDLSCCEAAWETASDIVDARPNSAVEEAARAVVGSAACGINSIMSSVTAARSACYWSAKAAEAASRCGARGARARSAALREANAMLERMVFELAPEGAEDDRNRL